MNHIAAMHRIIGDAIAELRRSKDWSQAELAREISRHARRGTPAPLPNMISLWETGARVPAPEYRVALARIARGDKKFKPGEKKIRTESKTAHLATLFLASLNAWEAVSAVRALHEQRHGRRWNEEGTLTQ
ncbi:MAG: helix-turn-helix domain-containing protein [Acidobacteria bacterium]|nr:helix-turn-helix domain-containing protein [Acidobacteriota bacterium]